MAVRTFQRAIATVTGNQLEALACVVEGLVLLTSTPLGCAMLRKRDAATQARNYAPEASFVDDAPVTTPVLNSDCDGNCFELRELPPHGNTSLLARGARRQGRMHRLKVNMRDATLLSAVYGFRGRAHDGQCPFHVQQRVELVLVGKRVGRHVFALYPEMVDDTYATLGLDGPARKATWPTQWTPTCGRSAQMIFRFSGGRRRFGQQQHRGFDMVLGGRRQCCSAEDMRVLLHASHHRGRLEWHGQLPSAPRRKA